ncbi:MAG: tRNA (N(6)-L-threonylcarbamoyladenosine(37)-C(2))-methylthiotransferase MtaB [Lachnospiraceae bacterium]|nr:tRNA (N(6)-L-threonylcarbamoyladenosine(37)-C(2))-methylthiotransferase MtaB [Lachnospiraceae bacterium]
MKSIALHNLGCKVNGYEIDVMQQMLQEKGYKIVPFDEAADIYIINTCTVTNIADRKSRQMIHRAKKTNPDAVVVAVGCYVQTGGDAVRKDDAIDLAIGNNRKKDLILILEDYLKKRENGEIVNGDERPEEGRVQRKGKVVTDIIDINRTDEYEEMTLTKTAEHTRAYIKIQDGCNQFCSYCIIPYARGRVRSRGGEEVLNEVRGIVQAGYKEIVLTGIHISSYGIDRGSPELLQLLTRLHSIDGLERIRLGSLEPRIVTEEFAGQISDMPKICPHFHLSLQSGCDSVLKRMNRHYSTGEYFRTTEILRKYYSDPAITTDVIVGFPGETEEEFRATEEFVRKVNFYEMHIFKYSRRQGTVAAAMKDQLTEAEKGRRSALLIEVEKQMSHAYRERHIGSEAEVLFEEKKEKDGEYYWIGHTPQYVKTARKDDGTENLANQIVKGTVAGFLDEDIMLLK